MLNDISKILLPRFSTQPLSLGLYLFFVGLIVFYSSTLVD